VETVQLISGAANAETPPIPYKTNSHFQQFTN
jgi:hypothetical protein